MDINTSTIEHLFNQKNISQTILGIIFSIYLIMGYKLPSSVATIVDTVYGKVIIVIIALILFAKFNPVLGILGFFVAYNLLTQSSNITGSNALQQYLPTEKKKYTAMTKYNQFPYTLEQEVVKKMAPINKYDSTGSHIYSFKPVLDDQHDAADINYNGII